MLILLLVKGLLLVEVNFIINICLCFTYVIFVAVLLQLFVICYHLQEVIEGSK